VTVDRRHDGLGMKEHRVVEPMQCRQESAYIIRPAGTEADEIDAG
jgi:hypothetical protein